MENGTATPADRQFLCKATILALTILQASRLARHCHNLGLRSLAEQSVRVLGRIDGESRRLARRLAVPVAERLDLEHRTQLAALKQLGGAAFEQMYLRKFAMETQLELIQLCGKELTDGASEILRETAGRWMQDLRSVVAPARRLYFAPPAKGRGLLRRPVERPVRPRISGM